MAGDDPTAVTDIPLIDVDTLMHRIESQHDLLRDILDTLRLANRARQVVRLSSVNAAATNRFRQAPRFFLETIVWNVSAASVPILEVGSGTYTFDIDVSPVVMPFPIVIDRGTDIRVTFGAGLTADVYLIGTVE